MSARNVAIICQLDGYANGVRPVEIERFLRARGHQVTVIDTYSLGRASDELGTLANKLPSLGVKPLALYLVEVASAVTRRWRFGRHRLSYYVLLAERRLRRSLLDGRLSLDDFDLVICETPHDSGVLTVPTSARTFYDCPTPWADELAFEGRLTRGQHARLRRLESQLFEQVDHLAFWWESYARYAVDHYGLSERNLLRLDFGCTPARQRARFASSPRVAYIGSLSSRFIDLPLLSRLTKLYAHVDVYGGPPPDPSLGLDYRGYASPSVLQHYQAGLITCTKDELRRDGFSAKHLQYLAYGLPVLVPVWRRDSELLCGSTPYDEGTFCTVIDALSGEREWQRMSDAAYAQAQRLTWEHTLSPLEALLTAPSA